MEVLFTFLANMLKNVAYIKYYTVCNWGANQIAILQRVLAYAKNW